MGIGGWFISSLQEKKKMPVFLTAVGLAKPREERALLPNVVLVFVESVKVVEC